MNNKYYKALSHGNYDFIYGKLLITVIIMSYHIFLQTYNNIPIFYNSHFLEMDKRDLTKIMQL